MEQYKIYISKEGVIKAILLPEEPKYPLLLNAPDSEFYKQFTHPELQYKSDKASYEHRCFKIKTSYNEQVCQAKKEGIQFKNTDQDKIIEMMFPFNENPTINLSKIKDTIHNLPEGYSVEVETEECKIETETGNHCGIENTCNQGCEKVAVLKKISPPLSVEKEDISEKEEFRKKWHQKFCLQGNNFEWLQFKEGINTWAVFDFFYSEIEKRDKALKESERIRTADWGVLNDLREQLKAGEELHDLYKRASEFTSLHEYKKAIKSALEKYQQLTLKQ